MPRKRRVKSVKTELIKKAREAMLWSVYKELHADRETGC